MKLFQTRRASLFPIYFESISLITVWRNNRKDKLNENKRIKRETRLHFYYEIRSSSILCCCCLCLGFLRKLVYLRLQSSIYVNHKSRESRRKRER